MSFGIDYAQLKSVTESKIATLSILSSPEDVALVALSAYQLQAIGLPPSNLAALISLQQSIINNLTAGSALDNVAIQAASAIPRKSVVWRMQEFIAGGSWTPPDNLAGDVVYVTAVGGGGSGAAGVRAGTSRLGAMGGFGGEYCVKKPLSVTVGAAIPVVIGAGGAAAVATASVTTSVDGLDGSNTEFGALVLAGGSGGRTTSTTHTYVRYGGGFPGFYNTDLPNATGTWTPPNVVNGFSGGALEFQSTGQSTYATGGGAGVFGSGPKGVVQLNANANGVNAAASSGAGGGGACVNLTAGGPFTATSGAGGSGRLIIEWQEYI